MAEKKNKKMESICQISDSFYTRIQIWGLLTLYHTIMTFNDPKKEAF